MSSVNEGSESFLLSICDMRVNYYGCADADAMRKLDFITIWFHLATLACCLGVLINRVARKLINGRRISEVFTMVDTLCLLAVFFHLSRLALFINLHFSSGPATHDEMAESVRLNMYFEFLAWSIGSLTISVFTLSVVKAVTNTNLMEPIIIGGQRVNAEKAISILRIILMILYLILFSLWAYSDTMEKFIFYRRACYLALGIVCITVSAPILAFFGYRVIGSLRANQGKSMRMESGVKSINGGGSVYQNLKVPLPSTAARKSHEMLNNNRLSVLSITAKRKASEPKKPVIRTSYRIFIMTMFIQIMVWAVYVNLGILCLSYVTISELFPHDSRVIMVTKGILDYYLWINGTHYIFYLYARGHDD